MIPLHIRITIFFLCIVAIHSGNVCAQPIPTYGTHFTFAIPEGPDNLIDPFGPADSSQIYLYIITSGCGTGKITSPSGYSTTFSFTSKDVTTIRLPYSLILLNDLGKQPKGILIETTEPVQVIFHDFFASAGEMTQIYPDDALDTSYRIATWGIYNDPTENNKTEFVITAPYDNTNVTIEPAVRPVGAVNNNTVTTTLNKGECYIVKADSNGIPSGTSLSGSLVRSTKPVSVISGLTCGYVPLGTEACNELLNMELPRRLTDTIFYTAPFSDYPAYGLMFVSDVADFFAISGGGLTYQSSNGVIEIPFVNRQEVFTVTAPAHCYQFSLGFELNRISALSDPSMITVMPRSQFLDSLEWFVPNFQGSFGQPFPNFVTIIYPTTAEAQLELDGLPAKTQATPLPIFGTTYSFINVQIPGGIHHIKSSEPVFAFASGFSVADAYSYNIGQTMPVVCDSLLSTFTVDTTEAKTCHDFTVAVHLKKSICDDLTFVHIELPFDTTLFSLLGIDAGPVAQANIMTIDTSIAGMISIDVIGAPTLDGDTICLFHFYAGPTASKSLLTLQGSIARRKPSCTNLQELRTLTQFLSIVEARDTEFTKFAFQIGTAKAGELAVGALSLTNALQTQTNSLTLRLQYNHDLLSLKTIAPSTLVTTIPPFTINKLDASTDEVIVSAPLPVLQTGRVLNCIFDVFETNVTSTPILFAVTLNNNRLCPLDIIANADTTSFTITDSCGSQFLGQALRSEPLHLTISPNPASQSIVISFSQPLPSISVSVGLSNILGMEVRHWEDQAISGSTTLSPKDVSGLPTGAYFLNIDIQGRHYSSAVMIRN